MLIEYDDYLGLWCIWQKDGSTYNCLYEAKTKKECESYIKKLKKKRSKKSGNKC